MGREYEIRHTFLNLFAFSLLTILPLTLLACRGNENPEVEVYFCNSTLCSGIISASIKGAKERVDCAFYSLKNIQILDTLDRVNVPKRVVVYSHSLNRAYAKKAESQGLMHNKFCIIDNEKVLTGSFNPNEKEQGNRDNLLLINSKAVARIYSAEFEELWEGLFGTGRAVWQMDGNFKIYFCPEDDCASSLIAEINMARREIGFMYYSLTSGEVALALIKAKRRGVNVWGVLESSQISPHSQFQLLQNQGIEVRVFHQKGLLHHKVMVIDGSTVVCGSYNPTRNAQLFNDENLIVVRNKELSERFLKELSGVFEASVSKNI